MKRILFSFLFFQWFRSMVVKLDMQCRFQTYIVWCESSSIWIIFYRQWFTWNCIEITFESIYAVGYFPINILIISKLQFSGMSIIFSMGKKLGFAWIIIMSIYESNNLVKVFWKKLDWPKNNIFSIENIHYN